MKSISIKTLFIALMVMTFGCDLDRIDDGPLGPTEADYFSNVNEFREALFAAYSDIYDIYGFVNQSNQQERGLYSLWYLPGDDITETNGSRTAEELFDGSLNPTNNRITGLWDVSYRIVQKSTVVIEKVNTVDFSDFDGADEIASMEGEAYFLRAYAYYRVFHVYGGAPLITTRLGADEVNQPRAEASAILDQVIADATAAEGILPEVWDDPNRGRATKNAARALLVKAHVVRANYYGNAADYSSALSAFSRITNNLLDDYAENFNAFNENNEESCFEWQAAAPTAINNIFLHNDGPWRGVENLSFFRGNMMSASNTPGAEAGWQSNTKYIVTNKLLAAANGDPRVLFWLTDVPQGYILEKYTRPDYNALSVPFQNSQNNERILRYGDLKLFAAEAELKSGNASAAIGHVNDLRQRAIDWGSTLTPGVDFNDSTVNETLTLPTLRNTGETDAATIMDWIMEERFVELAGEGHRWWDLKRWHEAGDINLAGWDGSDDNFSTALDANTFGFDVSTHLLFPIPQDEVERNSAILNNNPGY